MKKVECNGWSSDRARFSKETVDFVQKMLLSTKTLFETEYCRAIGFGGEYELGIRYKSLDSIITTLESAVSEQDFLHCPTDWIMAALKDCASRDYYYKYEKDWGRE